jgi:fucose permease
MKEAGAGKDTRIRRTGYGVFFLSGICAMSSGVVVSLLREQYGLSFARTGTLLSMMSIGNMLAAFLAGWLPGRIGTRAAILILCTGYTLGYGGTALTGAAVLLMAAFFLVGLAKGAALNRCTVMAGMHTENRTRSMQILHSCYACGALLCPFLINALSGVGEKLPLAGLAAAGLAMWLLLAFSGMEGRSGRTESRAQQRDRSFLRTKTFWLLTAMVFCQNAAETGVTGWLVTYYREREILSGVLSAYAMTIMWSATLIARLLIAFVLPIRNHAKALCVMGACCTALYALMIPLTDPVPAIPVLFLFSASIAGVNPMSTGMTGRSMSPESMGILLPIAACGGILMPAVIGFAANQFGLQTGMLTNLVPCLGIMILGGVLRKNERKAETA